MLNDGIHKTIVIPIRISDGRVVQLDNSPLPKLNDGAVGELTLLERNVLDEGVIQRLQAHDTVGLLSKGSSVFLGVSIGYVPSSRHEVLNQTKDLGIISQYVFVEVILDEILKLRFRGSKSAVLAPCACHIPVLQDQSALSLNHAFTQISTEFETKRLSHTGNVFERGFVKQRDRWHTLDAVRLAAQIDRPKTR